MQLECSLCFFIVHQIKNVNAEAIKKRKFGIPGIIPSRNKTPALGNQACLMPICEPICFDRSWLVETLVTIIAVAIARSKEGICATKPSPTDKII